MRFYPHISWSRERMRLSKSASDGNKRVKTLLHNLIAQWNMNIFSNFSPDKWRHLRPQILRLQVQVFRALVTRGESDGQSGGNQKRSRLEQGGKSVGRESEVWRQWILQSSSASDTRRPAAIHQIVSEVLDARMFWRTNFICLKSKRKDIWPICVWLRFRIQPNSIDIATNCIRQKGKNQLIQIMLFYVEEEFMMMK